MNFVGHIYLSGENEKLAIGNFIGDYVKGRKHESYPDEVQKGILIHRDIDATMDAHPAFLATRELFAKIMADMPVLLWIWPLIIYLPRIGTTGTLPRFAALPETFTRFS